METIIAAAVTGGLALLGVIITSIVSNRKSETKMETLLAVTQAKMEELTREVRVHNSFATRIPVLEERVNAFGRRITALEGRTGQPPCSEREKE